MECQAPYLLKDEFKCGEGFINKSGIYLQERIAVSEDSDIVKQGGKNI